MRSLKEHLLESHKQCLLFAPGEKLYYREKCVLKYILGKKSSVFLLQSIGSFSLKNKMLKGFVCDLIC